MSNWSHSFTNKKTSPERWRDLNTSQSKWEKQPRPDPRTHDSQSCSCTQPCCLCKEYLKTPSCLLSLSSFCLISYPKEHFFENAGGRVSFGKSYLEVMRQQGQTDKQSWDVFCWPSLQKQQNKIPQTEAAASGQQGTKSTWMEFTKCVFLFLLKLWGHWIGNAFWFVWIFFKTKQKKYWKFRKVLETSKCKLARHILSCPISLSHESQGTPTYAAVRKG